MIMLLSAFDLAAVLIAVGIMILLYVAIYSALREPW